MRYNDFKLVESKKLIESANVGLEAQHAMHDIEAISNAVSTLDPEVKSNVVTNLTGLAQKVRDFVTKNIKQATQPAPQPQTEALGNEDQEAQDALARLKADIATIEASDIDDTIKANFLTSLNETLDKLTKASENITTSRDSARTERDEASNFVKDVTGVLVTLGNKVQGYTV